MIRPSLRRRRSSGEHGQLFDLHRRISRGRDLYHRLQLSSALALAVAIISWALGLDLPVRAASVLVAGVSAWLVPLRPSDTWALEWIARRSGLAYQTALETEGEEDHYGLRRAVIDRAGAEAARLDEPRHPAWWLPVLALAVGALLLPALPGIGPGGTGPGAALPGGGSSSTPATAVGEDAEPEAPQIGDQERERLMSEAGDAQTPRSQREAAEEGGSASEREALERYLRSVRERSATEEVPRDQDGSAPDGSEQPGRPREGARDRGQPAGEGEERSGAQQQREGDAEGEGQQASETDDGGAGERSNNPFAEAAGEESDGGGRPAEQSEQSGSEGEEAEGLAEAEQGVAEQAEAEQGDGTGPSEEEGAGDQEGQIGDGAGGTASPERGSQIGETEEGEALFLDGDLRSGPLAPGGAVQLPGSVEGDPPLGSPAGTYRREVERAVTEGRIPLEYQEIIRNYFR